MATAKSSFNRSVDAEARASAKKARKLLRKYELKCYGCEVRRKLTDVDAYCVDCNEYFCSSCQLAHLDHPVLEQHVLLDSVDFVKGAKQMQKFRDDCELHKGLLKDMCCEHHRVMGCNRCMTLDHIGCTVYYIPHYAQLIKTEQQHADNHPAGSDDLVRAVDSCRENENAIEEVAQCREKETVSVDDDLSDKRRMVESTDANLKARQEEKKVEEAREDHVIGDFKRKTTERVEILAKQQHELKMAIESGAKKGDPKLEELVDNLTATIDAMEKIEDPAEIKRLRPNPQLMQTSHVVSSFGTVTVKTINYGLNDKQT